MLTDDTMKFLKIQISNTEHRADTNNLYIYKIISCISVLNPTIKFIYSKDSLLKLRSLAEVHILVTFLML